MSSSGYNMFCPIAMACDMLEPRWTMLILCEMWSGSTRFSEIQRGVPGMSPSLLTRRLRDMENKGLVVRTAEPDGHIAYRTTTMADEIEPLVHALGAWAHRRIDPAIQLEHLDDHLLMWNIRRKIQVRDLPRRKVVIQFILQTPGELDKDYWLIVRPDGQTDLCMIDPRFEVALYVVADLRALTSAWMGHSTFAHEVAQGAITLIGDEVLARSMPQWLRRSSYAGDDTEAGCGSAPPRTARIAAPRGAAPRRTVSESIGQGPPRQA